MSIIELTMDDKTIPNACVVKTVEQLMLKKPASTATTTATPTPSINNIEDLNESIENEIEKISKSRPKKKISNSNLNSNNDDGNSIEDDSGEDEILEKSDCLEEHCHQVRMRSSQKICAKIYQAPANITDFSNSRIFG